MCAWPLKESSPKLASSTGGHQISIAPKVTNAEAAKLCFYSDHFSPLPFTQEGTDHFRLQRSFKVMPQCCSQVVWLPGLFQKRLAANFQNSKITQLCSVSSKG